MNSWAPMAQGSTAREAYSLGPETRQGQVAGNAPIKNERERIGNAILQTWHMLNKKEDVNPQALKQKGT